MEFFRGKREKWWNALGVRVKLVEFFRGKGEQQRNSSGATPPPSPAKKKSHNYFSRNSLGVNKDCMKFLRGCHVIRKILEG